MWLSEYEFLKAFQFMFSKKSFLGYSCWGISETILPGSTQWSHSDQAVFHSTGEMSLAPAVTAAAVPWSPHSGHCVYFCIWCWKVRASLASVEYVKHGVSVKSTVVSQKEGPWFKHWSAVSIFTPTTPLRSNAFTIMDGLTCWPVDLFHPRQQIFSFKQSFVPSFSPSGSQTLLWCDSGNHKATSSVSN